MQRFITIFPNFLNTSILVNISKQHFVQLILYMVHIYIQIRIVMVFLILGYGKAVNSKFGLQILKLNLL